MKKIIQNFNNQKHRLATFAFLFLALILFIIGMIWRIIFYEKSEIVINKNQDNFLINKNDKQETFVDSKKNFQLNENWVEAKYEYPENNVFVKNKIEKIYNSFISENKKDALDIQKERGNNDLKYSFNANYSIASSTNSVSYIYEVYNFTGGAHGSINYNVTTLDKTGKEINIEAVLPTDKLEKIAPIAFNEIQKIRRQRIIDSDANSDDKNEMLKNISAEDSINWVKEGTAPKRENYNIAWIDGNNIIIYFGQYQVASYAEGDFEIKIPINSL
jgi:hypothetical protein